MHLPPGCSLLDLLLYVLWTYPESFMYLQTLHECESFLNQHDQTTWKDSIPPDTLNIIDKFHDVFLTSMSDDLHTPVVLAGMSDPLKSMNDLLHTRKVRCFILCI